MKVSTSSIDPIVEWINSHPEEIRKNRGKRVAVHSTRGIVASGENLKAVFEEVRKLGLLDEVTFESIPNFE